jgi:ribonuclease P protein component
VTLKSNHFQRELRLLTSKDYSHVFQKAFKINNKAFTLLVRENNLNHPRIGLVIAKKNLKLATKRNQVKRLLRESFRTSSQEMANYDLVVLTRRDIAQMPKTDIIRYRDDLMARFIKRCTKTFNTQR